MTLLTSGQKAKHRADGHKSLVYLSVNQPETLLTAVVDGVTERGATAIVFKDGSGTVSRIQEGQTLRVTIGGRYYATRVVSFSGTESAGTITVDPNGIAWEDEADLALFENYELRVIPPTFDPETGISTKRGQVYSNQGKQAPPVCKLGTHRAGWLTDGPPDSASVQIAAGGDDGYVGSNDSFDNSGAYFAFGNPAISWDGFLRFDTSIPQGSTITGAYITLTSIQEQSGVGRVRIYGEAADDPIAPTDAADYNGRARTTEFVDWVTSSLWGALEAVQTPDISSVIQEIVSRPGFGGAINLFLQENGTDSGYSRLIAAHGGGMGDVAELTVTYLLPPSVTFDIDLSDSYANAPGATIPATGAYALSIQPSTGATIDFDVDAGTGTVEIGQAGQYWLSGSVTDSNGKQHTSHRRIFAHDPDPESDDYPYVDFVVSPITISDEGSGGVDVMVHGVADFTEFVDGALVVFWQDSWYGSEAGAISLITGGENILFTGYILGDTIDRDWQHGTVKFRVVIVTELMKQFRLQGLSIHAENVPAYWFQYDYRLTIARMLHWHGYWHSTLFEIADVTLPASSQYKKLFKFNEGTLFSQWQSLAGTLLASVGCNKAGQVFVERDIQMLDGAGRAAVDVITEVTQADLRETLTIQRRHKNQTNVVRLSGFNFDGQTITKLCSIAPNRTGTDSGPSGQALDNLVLASQAEANLLSGRALARQNNDVGELRPKFAGNYSALDVWPQRWLTLTLAAGDTPRGIVWTDKRLAIRQITINIDQVNGVITVDGVCEPEADGPDGVNDPCPDVPAAPENEAPWSGPGVGALLAFSSVHLRDDGASDWTEKNSGNAGHGRVDPLWTSRQGSTDPNDAIVWWVDGGKIYRSVDGGITAQDVTPATDPPDTWGDGPTVGNSTFVCILPDRWNQGRFFALERQQIADSWRGWLAVTDDDGVSWQRLELYDGVTLPDEVYPVWPAVNGAYVLVTCWHYGDTMKLLVFDAATLAYVDEYALGTATLAEVVARTLYAFPVTVLDNDDWWDVAGRMVDPVGLSGVYHIVQTEDAGTGWASVDDTHGAAHVASLTVGLLSGTDRAFDLGVQAAIDAPPELAPGTETELQDDVSTERWVTYIVPIDSNSAYVFIVGDSAPTRRVYTMGSGFGAPTELTNATATLDSVSNSYPPSSNQTPSGRSFVAYWDPPGGVAYSLINLPTASTVQILHDTMATDIATMLGSNRIALYDGRNIAVIENYAAGSPVDAKADYTDILPSTSARYAHSNLSDTAVGVSENSSNLIAWIVGYDGSFVPTLLDSETLTDGSIVYAFVKISDTEYWAFYTDAVVSTNPDDYTLYMAQLTVSGSSLSWGTPVEVYTIAPADNKERLLMMINPLSSSRALLYYMERDLIAATWSIVAQTIELGVGLDDNAAVLDSQENAYDNASVDPYGWSLFKISDAKALASWYSDDAERIFREVDIS